MSKAELARICTKLWDMIPTVKGTNIFLIIFKFSEQQFAVGKQVRITKVIRSTNCCSTPAILCVRYVNNLLMPIRLPWRFPAVYATNISRMVCVYNSTTSQLPTTSRRIVQCRVVSTYEYVHAVQMYMRQHQKSEIPANYNLYILISKPSVKQ